MPVDFLKELLEMAEAVAPGFLSNWTIGCVLFAILLTVYALYDVAVGSFWAICYPENEALKVLILRLCWAMFITLTFSMLTIGTFAYLSWKLRRLSNTGKWRAG